MRRRVRKLTKAEEREQKKRPRMRISGRGAFLIQRMIRARRNGGKR